jgi:hypothetical protein
MISDEELNQIIENLTLSGYIEVDGIDADSGEFLYRISDRLKEEIPDLQKQLYEAFLGEVYSLWIKGFITMDFHLDNPMVRLTEQAFDAEKVKALSLEEKTTLSTIMIVMKQN